MGKGLKKRGGSGKTYQVCSAGNAAKHLIAFAAPAIQLSKTYSVWRRPVRKFLHANDYRYKLHNKTLPG